MWRRLDDLIERAALGRFVFPALALAERLAPGTMDARSLASAEAAAPPRLRRRVRCLTPVSAQRLFSSPVRDRFFWVTSPREVPRLLLHAIWPQPGGRPLAPRRALAYQWARVRGLVARMVGRRPI